MRRLMLSLLACGVFCIPEALLPQVHPEQKTVEFQPADRILPVSRQSYLKKRGAKK